MPDREKVINGLREMSCRATWKDIDRIRDKFQPIINNALAMLKEQENKQETIGAAYGLNYVDYIQIIRCKDCKYVCMCDSTELFPDMPIYAKCTLTDEIHEPNWFCADGEMKE